MSFTKESNDLMKFFANNFHKLSSKKKKSKQKNTDKIIEKIFDDIKISSRFIDIIINSTKFRFKSIKIDNWDQAPKTDLLQSSFVPKNIYDKIKFVNGCLQVDCKISDKNITIYIFTFDNSYKNLNHYKNYIKNMLMVIRILLLYSNSKKGSLKIFLYLTKEKKMIHTDPLKILDKNCCNTAVTTACNSNGSVLIYRQEEWFKVLIHELFHILCLDFNSANHSETKSKFKNLINIKSQMEISEAYCEFWASILNCCFCAYNLLDDPCNKSTFLLYTEFCIEFERTFSFFQCFKILNFMGLNYKEFVSNESININLKKTLYRENTNVFTYYILKMVLLYDYDEFLQWCDINNSTLLKFRSTPNNFNNFFKFFKKRYNDKMLKQIIDKEMGKMYHDLNSGTKFPYKQKILKTLRMTICETKLI